jgi:hypothetical protein
VTCLPDIGQFCPYSSRLNGMPVLREEESDLGFLDFGGTKRRPGGTEREEISRGLAAGVAARLCP